MAACYDNHVSDVALPHVDVFLFQPENRAPKNENTLFSAPKRNFGRPLQPTLALSAGTWRSSGT